MTRDEAIHKVVSFAYDQVGYREGADNWNKYAANPKVQEAIGWDCQNQPWCAIFVVAMFVESFGYYQGKSMMYGCSASCAQQADYYLDNAAYIHSNPQKGDQIFFNLDGGINHTGIVVDVSGSTITTIEGNYSDGVCTNTYFVRDDMIAGFGRPCWDIVADDPESTDDPISEERTAPIVKYPDGVGGHPTDLVRAWQTFLVQWGYSLAPWGIDGEFGETTLRCTKDLQRKTGLEETGIVDTATWQQGILVPRRGEERHE